MVLPTTPMAVETSKTWAAAEAVALTGAPRVCGARGARDRRPRGAEAPPEPERKGREEGAASRRRRREAWPRTDTPTSGATEGGMASSLR